MIDCLQRVRVSAGVQKARTSYLKRELRSEVKNKGWSVIRVDDNFKSRYEFALRLLLSRNCWEWGRAGDELGWQCRVHSSGLR